MDATPQITLATADEPDLVEAARQLFREYAQAIGVDLCFQNFDAEVENLPGEYAAPEGALLVALLDGQPAGCGALRPLRDVDYPNACEMKRLYVPRAFRRFGLGRLIAQQLIDLAMQAGYSTLLLDTLDEMESARELDATLGFEEVAPGRYRCSPLGDYAI